MKHYTIKAYGAEWMYRAMFSWRQHLLEASGQVHILATLPQWNLPPPNSPSSPSTPWTGAARASEPVWMTWTKFLPLSWLEVRPLGHAAPSQSICWLCHPSFTQNTVLCKERYNGLGVHATLYWKYVKNNVSELQGIILYIYINMPSHTYCSPSINSQ